MHRIGVDHFGFFVVFVLVFGGMMGITGTFVFGTGACWMGEFPAALAASCSF